MPWRDGLIVSRGIVALSIGHFSMLKVVLWLKQGDTAQVLVGTDQGNIMKLNRKRRPLDDKKNLDYYCGHIAPIRGLAYHPSFRSV